MRNLVRLWHREQEVKQKFLKFKNLWLVYRYTQYAPWVLGIQLVPQIDNPIATYVRGHKKRRNEYFLCFGRHYFGFYQFKEW